MNEQDIDQKYDELLMIIYSGKAGSGRKLFANTIRTAINQTLDRVTALLEEKRASALVDEIHRFRSN